MRMIVSMDMEYIPGTTENNMKDGGKTENNTVKEFIEKTEETEEESGKTEKELNGQTMLNGTILKMLEIQIETNNKLTKKDENQYKNINFS